MSTLFWDTSALIKAYHPESGTPKALSLLDDPTNDNRISRVALVEWHSVFARKLRTDEVTLPNLNEARRAFYRDMHSRRIRVVDVDKRHFRRAIRLLKRIGPSRALLTLDALQLGAAFEQEQQDLLDTFVCADATLCDIARAEGLNVLNPEE